MFAVPQCCYGYPGVQPLLLFCTDKTLAQLLTVADMLWSCK